MNTRKIFLGLTLVTSVLVGAMTALYHERLFNKCEVEVTLPENWKRISVQEKLDSLDGLLSKNATFPMVSEIRQLNIKRQFTKMIADQEDDILRAGRQYRFAFRFFVGWEELVLLGLIGFASVWVIYGSVRVFTLLIPSAPLKHFPSPALKEPEERPKRLRKPAAVWID
jgi:hypothetical protein